MDLEKSKYTDLINQIGGLLQKGREQAAKSVNSILVQLISYSADTLLNLNKVVRKKQSMEVSFSSSFQKIYQDFMVRDLADLTCCI
jgi:hypothetical protein